MHATAVVIGHWQLPHEGQMERIRAALGLAQQVVVVIGSAWQSRSCQGPWVWQERKQMIKAAVTPEQASRLRFVPVRDYASDEHWAQDVRDAVRSQAPSGDIVLVDHPQDTPRISWAWLDNWTVITVPRGRAIASTVLRQVYLSPDRHPRPMDVVQSCVAPGVEKFLRAWMESQAYSSCAKEQARVTAYRAKWNAPSYLTADAVVLARHEGVPYVALVRRKEGTIGEGLWALPGGFVEPREEARAAAVRELREESGLALTPSTVARKLKAEKTFSNPYRSPRGRLVTHAFFFDLGDVPVLPELVGADDVDAARWTTLNELALMSEALFEDHGLILRHFGLG